MRTAIRVRRPIALLAILACAVLLRAGSATPVDDADKAYFDNDLDKALEILRPYDPTDSTERARKELLIGVVYATRSFDNLQDKAARDQAETHFAQAVSLDPFVSLNDTTSTYRSDVVGLFNVMRTDLLRGEQVDGSGVGGKVGDAELSAKQDAMHRLIARYFRPESMQRDPMPTVLERQIYSTPDQFITVFRSVPVEQNGPRGEMLIHTIINSDSIAQIATSNGVILDKLDQPTLAIVVEESSLGDKPRTGGIVETQLKDEFTRYGFAVYDLAELARLSGSANLGKRLQSDLAFASQVADSHGVDILLSGTASASSTIDSVFGGQIRTGEATVQTGLVWLATGETICTQSGHVPLEAAGESGSGAAKKALQAVAEQVAPKLIVKCIEDWNNAQVHGRRIQVVLKNIRNDQMDWVTDRIRLITQAPKIAVFGFERGADDTGTATFLLQSRLSMDKLRQCFSEPDQARGLQLYSLKRSRIELRMR